MSERDMTAPVTRGEMYEALEIWAGRIVGMLREEFKKGLTETTSELRALIKATEQNLMTRMDAMFDPHRSLPERVGKLEEAALPERVSKLEAKVLAPRRRAPARTKRPRS